MLGEALTLQKNALALMAQAFTDKGLGNLQRHFEDEFKTRTKKRREEVAGN